MDLDHDALAVRLGPEDGTLAGALLPKLNCSRYSGHRLGKADNATPPD